MEDSEKSWIQQAVAGDQAAFTRLVEAYQNPVYNLAYRLLGNSVEAEDAAQETFIRAYLHLESYDPGRKFSSWLLSIASHYCIDLLRRRRMNLISVDDLPPMVELSMPRATQPEQIVIQGQAASDVQRMLESLDPAYRTPVVLRYWYDMSYREIAELMGVTESTVKTRLHRARAKLAREAQNTLQNADEDRVYAQTAV
ncbi:MAG: sigma-70 family RNA polymerase sigma factor [Anaerolineae bacterium]|nr:sigma-70 family RNA polymerase sigma factor [Anaerolineae bacterium]